MQHNFNTYNVQELSADQLQEINGGIWLELIILAVFLIGMAIAGNGTVEYVPADPVTTF